MNLNLKYYNEKDKYSDGDVENTILELIKKYPNDYEEAFKEDSSWPTVYHLSDTRKNVIRWYPFKEEASVLEVGAGMGAITDELCHLCKKVTSIELSKRRATAILERNKDEQNLEIIVGNFKDIKLTEKYDYILLNGVLEYAALYMDTNNPYEDFITRLKKNLKPDGKILVAIENKNGLKYWCGANEDHTGKMFDGLNNYPDSNNIRTFSKYELENLARNVGMFINFYYMFPDYKFPKIVLTDKFLDKNIFVDYSPYFCGKMNIILNEQSLYKEIFNNKMVPFFANSYFLELSNKQEDIKVEFAKFNSEYRKQEYNLCTYLKDNKYYKKALSDKTINHINTILKINDICKKSDINIINVHKDKKQIYTNSVDGIILTDIIKDLYKKEDYEKIEKIFDDVYNLIKKSAGNKVKKENNIFEKYGITKYPNNLEFYEHGIIDIVPNNIIVKADKMYLIDQEWYEENIPLEFIMFRGIYQIFNQIDNDTSLRKKLYNKYNINEKLFLELEEKFVGNIKNNFYPIFVDLCNNAVYYGNVNFLVEQMKQVPILQNAIEIIQKEKETIIQEKENLNIEYNKVINSRGWKTILKLRKIVNIFRKR